ncbi:MAG: hypothetical protein WD068_03165 [Candidatus Babeliales bacterium]
MKRYIQMLVLVGILNGIQVGTVFAMSGSTFAETVYNRLEKPYPGLLKILEKIFPKLKRVSELKAAYKAAYKGAIPELTGLTGLKESLQEYIEKNSGKSWEELKKANPKLTDEDLYDASAEMMNDFFKGIGVKDMNIGGKRVTPLDLLKNTPGNLLADILVGPVFNEGGHDFEIRIRRGLRNVETDQALYMKDGPKKVFKRYFDMYKNSQTGKTVTEKDVTMPELLEFMRDQGGISVTGLAKMGESELTQIRDMNFNEFSNNKSLLESAGDGLNVTFKEPTIVE